jgi:hypothetical protein
MARKLRREQGLSIRDIEKRLSVSRASVSLWVRDIELTQEQHEALLRRNPIYNGQRIGQAVRSGQCRHRRLWWQVEGRVLAGRGDPFHAAACMLYWAEGSKQRNLVQISNADPEVLRFFARFLRSYFGVKDEKFRVACNLFADHVQRQHDVEQFWLDTLALPRSCLTRSIVNVYSRHSKRKRLNMLPYGTCRLTVCSTQIVQHIYGAIQEYGGFERPEWVD